MEWKEIGVNVEVQEEMFPMILRRDDGKLVFYPNYKKFLRRFLTKHRWTHILVISTPNWVS